MTRFVLEYLPLANEVRTSATNNSCSFDRAVVAGNGDVVHVEWIYPHPSRVGRRDDLDTVNTGPPDCLTLRSQGIGVPDPAKPSGMRGFRWRL